MTCLNFVVWTFTEKKQLDKMAEKFGADPGLNQSPPSWGSQPKFPTLSKCHFHWFCLVIESLPLPRRIPLTPLQGSCGALLSIAEEVLSAGPLGGAGQQSLLELGNQDASFCPPAFSQRRAGLRFISVLLAYVR